MNYKIIGTGEKTIVLVHGYCADYKVWDYFVEQLKTEYKLLIVSIPGYLSEPHPNADSLDKLAEDIRMILEKEELQKIHFVGHSMGGYIGLCLLEKKESAMSALTLLNSHCYRDEEDRKTNREKTIQFLQKNGSELYVREIYKSLFSKAFQIEHPEIVEMLKTRAKSYDSAVLIQSCRAMISRRNHEKTLAKATIPIQFILGKMDDLIPIEPFVQQTLLPKRAHIALIENMGHMGMFEFKEATLNQILAFNKYATKIDA